MVDVQVGIGPAPLGDEVDEGLEGRPLLFAVAPPQRLELGLAVLQLDPPPQVLQPALEEGVALEVEEEVARRGLWQAREPAQLLRLQDLEDPPPFLAGA